MTDKFKTENFIPSVGEINIDTHKTVGLNKDKHMDVITCFRKHVLSQWCERNKIESPVIFDSIFSGDVIDILNEFNNLFTSSEIRTIVINDEAILNLLRALKIASHNNDNVTGCSILTNILIFIKDQVISESLKITNDDNIELTPTPESKVSSTLGFSNITSCDIPIDFFKNVSEDNIKNFKQIANDVKTSLNNLVNVIYLTMKFLNNVDFISLQDGNGVYGANTEEEKSELRFESSPLLEEIKDKISSDTWLDDMFYFMAYNLIQHNDSGICKEEFRIDDDAVNSINSFKFPDSVYTHKQSLNIFTNLMLDLSIR